MRGVVAWLALGVVSLVAADVPFVWTGAVTDRSAVTVIGTEETPVLRGPSGEDLAPARTGDGLSGSRRVDWAGLQPSTPYEVIVGGKPVARFRTAPVPGQRASFGFAVGSCNQNPDSRVFRAISTLNPAFMVVTGDFHYSDIAENDPNLFARAILANVESPNQGDFWRKTPVVYMWDDHDYGPNDSDRTSPSRGAAFTAYGDLVPHYPLALSHEGHGVAQSFTWGRVHFVVTDLRSERERGRSIMSPQQMKWLRKELSRAGREFPLVFWISSVPWNGNDNNEDRWSGYAEQRREISNFIAEERLAGRIAILAGDAHMCAIDDGANTDFSSSGQAPLPIFQAAALERRPSYKGGPYNRGARPGSLQFGWVEVEDSGAEIRVKWSARDGSDETGTRVLAADRDATGPIEYEFRVPAK